LAWTVDPSSYSSSLARARPRAPFRGFLRALPRQGSGRARGPPAPRSRTSGPYRAHQAREGWSGV